MKIAKYSKAKEGAVGTSAAIGGAGINSSALAGYVTVSQLNRALSSYLPRIEFDDMFERIVTGSDAEGNDLWYIWAKSHLVGKGEITAYGNGGGSGSGSGSGSGGGASYLRELMDVSIPGTPSAGQVLMWNTSALNGAGGWVAASISAGLDEAALGAYLSKNGYATETYVTDAVAQIDLSGYVLRKELPDFNTFALADDLKNYVTNIALAETLAGYVTIGTEQTIKARKRFEREIVLGTAEDHVTLSYADGALHIDGHVLARGEVTAYGDAGSGSIGTGLLLGDLADVDTAGVEDGMALVYSGGKLKPGAVAAGDVGGDYVTLDTEQMITGLKKFKSHIDIRGTNDNFTNRPYLLLHIPDVAYSKMVIDNGGHWHLVEGGQTDYVNYRKIKAAGFITPGGTASQALMADGSVRAVAEVGNPYGMIPSIRTDGVMEVGKYLDFHDSASHTADFSTRLSSENGSMYITGALILTALNYTTTLDGRYVNKAGDTMTGALNIAPSNGYAQIALRASSTAGGDLHLPGALSRALAMTTMVNGAAVGSLAVLTDGTPAYVDSTYTSTYKLWHAGNDGSGSGLDADLLDGYHEGSFFRVSRGGVSTAFIDIKAYTANAAGYANYAPGAYTVGRVGHSDLFINFGNTHGSCSALQLLTSYGDGSDLLYRKAIDANRVSGPWRKIITEINIGSHNAGSATKLQTARSLWGNSFDGTADLSGAIQITSQNGFFGRNATAYAGHSWNNGIGAFTVGIQNNEAQTPILLAVRQFSGWGATGANRLFAMELLNTGSVLCFGFGGSGRFNMYSSGTFHATGDVTASGNMIASGSIALTHNTGNAGYGISLYGGAVHVKNYGILFALTSYMVKHGSVQGEWATYLTMAGADNRGWIFYNAYKKAGVFSISAAGNVLANGEVTAYSDRRLKQEIREVVVQRGCRLRPVSYYKDGARHVGLIAQDVQPLCPEAVYDSGEYLALSYNAALVYGFAGVYSEIDALRERVRELETEVKRLKAA